MREQKARKEMGKKKNPPIQSHLNQKAAISIHDARKPSYMPTTTQQQRLGIATNVKPKHPYYIIGLSKHVAPKLEGTLHQDYNKYYCSLKTAIFDQPAVEPALVVCLGT